MTKETQSKKAEMQKAPVKDSGRNPRGMARGASSVAGNQANGKPECVPLMEAVVAKENVIAALERVESNNGAAGVDQITAEELRDYLRKHWPRIKRQLLEGRYQPQPVRGVEIPKNGGGMRQLGIPTVVDRMLQQMLVQVMTPMFDPEFSESSHGFRVGRSQHGALAQMRDHVASGRRWVVDTDLEKFFDRVHHDILMVRIKRKVSDKRVLRLINRFLKAGIMKDGLVRERTEGTPQGGPLSPLLSNIMLDDLDKELERRGHKFVRYADDCNIYVHSKAAGERVLASITRFLDEKLKLKVNSAKSAVDRPWRRKFLGYSMTADKKRPKLRVAEASVTRQKEKLKDIFGKARGWSLVKTIEILTPILRGWVTYYRMVDVKGTFEEMDGWIRRHLRAIRWRQWKRVKTRATNLIRLGLKKDHAWESATNGRGPWWNSQRPHMHYAYPKSYFDQLGLLSLRKQWDKLYTNTL
jgi:RNA-directed DNA polymerase